MSASEGRRRRAAERKRSKEPTDCCNLVVKCRDGRTFDFSPFHHLAGVVEDLAVAFSWSLSSSEDLDARTQTNRGQFQRIRVLLRWVEKQRDAGRWVLCTLSLHRYQRYLLGSALAASTVWHYYQTAAQMARALIDRGRLKPFLVPPNTSQQEALAAGQGSKTLVDQLDVLPKGMTRETANVDLLKLLLFACDRGARAIESRLELGQRWREDVASGAFTPPLYLLGKPYSEWQLERGQLVELACKLALHCWMGSLPSRRAAEERPDSPEARLFAAVVWGKGAAGLKAGGASALGAMEVRSYLAPTTDYLALVHPFFAASGINPHSIRRLKVDQLERDSGRPDAFARVVFDKPRAGGETAIEFLRVGEPDEVTLPRLWERVLKATADLRRRVSPKLRPYLLIAEREKLNWRCRQTEMRAPNPITLFKHVLRPWLLQCSGHEEALRLIAPKLTPKLIRTTVINIANERMGRSSELSARPFGHRPAVLDLTYIISTRVRAELESIMAEAQSQLEAWLRTPIGVVPDTVDAIKKAAGVDGETAAAVRRGDLTGLNGVCLVNECALVVDTPTNYARMLQWRQQLLAAEARMKRDHPQRWAERYAPQIPLFEDALHDFSRRTRREGERLSSRVALPMDEIA